MTSVLSDSDTGAEIRGPQIGGVHVGAWLELPAVGEAAGVDRLETDLLDQVEHLLLGPRVVTGDRDAVTLVGAAFVAVFAQVVETHRVERLDHVRTAQM